MIRFFKCRHEFVKHPIVENGVTLGGMSPTIKFSQRSICKKCGKIEEKEFIIPGHRNLYPERYDKNGWPIDKNGHKMQINTG